MCFFAGWLIEQPKPIKLPILVKNAQKFKLETAAFIGFTINLVYNLTFWKNEMTPIIHLPYPKWFKHAVVVAQWDALNNNNKKGNLSAKENGVFKMAFLQKRVLENLQQIEQKFNYPKKDSSRHANKILNVFTQFNRFWHTKL